MKNLIIKNDPDQLRKFYQNQQQNGDFNHHQLSNHAGIEKQPEEMLLLWKAKEYDKMERHRLWNIIMFLIFFSLTAYALFTDNLLMAILFILIGVSIYIFENKEPHEYNFGITLEGILAQDRIYEFSSLESFWIFYEPSGRKELSIKSKKSFLPHIHLPLGNTHPVEVRDLLINFLPEVEQEEGLVDALQRFL